MKALVTGANGFIGTHLCIGLLEHGYTVFAIIRSETNLELKSLDNTNFHIIRADLHNIESINNTIDNVDICFHFAWEGIRGENLLEYNIQMKNVEYCIKLMYALKKLGCNRFIGAGTIGQDELIYNTGEPIDDKQKIYRYAKDLCERLGKSIADDIGIEFFYPHITNTYGAGEQSDRFIISVVKKLLYNRDVGVSEGKQIYDFVYIDDLVEAFIKIAEKGIRGRRYVIGSGNAKPLREWLAEMPSITNTDAKLIYGQYVFNGVYLPKETFDITELTKDVGYDPQISFCEGIRKTVEWIRENENR